MLKITTAKDGAQSLYDDGVRSWHTGLTDVQRAQLRALEQGSEADLNPYASLKATSHVNQRRAYNGLAPLTSGVMGHGMADNGTQVKIATPSSPNGGAGTGQVSAAVQPGAALWDVQNGPVTAQLPPSDRFKDWGSANPQGTYSFDSRAETGPSITQNQSMTNMHNAAHSGWKSQYQDMMSGLNQDTMRQARQQGLLDDEQYVQLHGLLA